MSERPRSGVLLLTGVMASGKSTVADAVARSFPRGVHLRGDSFRRAIVAGREEPDLAMTAAAYEQLLLRYRLAAQAADTYARAGFFVVLQDVVMGPVLPEVVALLTTRPRYLVVLDPDPATVRSREAQRAKTGYGSEDPAEHVEVLRRTTPRLGLWWDSSQQTPDQTVRSVLAALSAADALLEPVDPPPPT